MPKEIRIKAQEERLVEPILLERWQHIQKYCSRVQHITLWSNEIYIPNKLHGKVIIDILFYPNTW